MNAVRAASLEELLSRSWLPDEVGLAVYEDPQSATTDDRDGDEAGARRRHERS